VRSVRDLEAGSARPLLVRLRARARVARRWNAAITLAFLSFAIALGLCAAAAAARIGWALFGLCGAAAVVLGSAAFCLMGFVDRRVAACAKRDCLDGGRPEASAARSPARGDPGSPPA
jgi:hypothetical protein